MSLIHWRNFSRRPEIKNLPMQQQKKLFEEANRKATENNWFLEAQLVAGASGAAFSGIGVDGPIAGATVTSNVGITTTNANGEFTFASTPTGPITLLGGKDSITGVDFEGELVGFPQYKTISPITTFAHYLQLADAEESRSPMTIDEAVTKTFASSSTFFGVELPLEEKDVILQKDFVREAIENNNKVGISAQAVTTQIEAIAETVGASLVGSQTQRDFTKKYGSAGVIPQFTVQNRKRTAYAALGRSVLDRGDINVEKVTEKVKYVNPITGNDKNDTITFGSNLTRLTKQLEETITETRTLAKSEQFTNNYLTTRIQALNRAQKTTIKNEAATAVAGGSDFSKIQSISTSSAIFNGLSRIETDKANETTPQFDKVNDWLSAGTFTQERFNSKFNTTSQETLIFRAGVIDANYKYYGDIKDNPMLLSSPKVGVFAPAQFPAAANNDASPLNSGAIFAKLPLTHTTQNTNDTTGAITTQTTVFRPYILEQVRGETPSLVGLRLSSLTTAVVQPKNTVDHIPLTGGTYEGTFKTGAGKAQPIIRFARGAASKEDPTVSMNITVSKSGESYRLQPITKAPGTFELLDAKNAVVATNLRFVSDRLTINWTDSGGARELFIKFSAVTLHIASQGVYSISFNGGAQTIMTRNLNLGGQYTLAATIGKAAVTLAATNFASAPNGPFTFNYKPGSGIETDTTGLQFNSTNEMSIQAKGVIGTYVIRYINL